MLRSDYCSLHDQDDVQLAELGECPYDQARPPLDSLIIRLRPRMLNAMHNLCIEHTRYF